MEARHGIDDTKKNAKIQFIEIKEKELRCMAICVLFDNMNCFAWIRTAADLSLIDDCVRSDEKALGGH